MAVERREEDRAELARPSRTAKAGRGSGPKPPAFVYAQASSASPTTIRNGADNDSSHLMDSVPSNDEPHVHRPEEQEGRELAGRDAQERQRDTSAARRYPATPPSRAGRCAAPPSQVWMPNHPHATSARKQRRHVRAEHAERRARQHREQDAVARAGVRGEQHGHAARSRCRGRSCSMACFHDMPLSISPDAKRVGGDAHRHPDPQRAVVPPVPGRAAPAGPGAMSGFESGDVTASMLRRFEPCGPPVSRGA